MFKPVFTIIFAMVLAYLAGWFSHDLIGSIYYLGPTQAEQGDILHLGRRPFRFSGIDAPAPGTTAGDAARDYLEFVVTDRFVWCRHTGDFSDSEYIGFCYAGLESLNRRMVAEGFARDCPAFSDGEYAELEDRARGMNRGLWGEGAMFDITASCQSAVSSSEDNSRETEQQGTSSSLSSDMDVTVPVRSDPLPPPMERPEAPMEAAE